MTTITTDRLILRQAREDDLDDLFAVMSNRQAMRYWSTPPHADPAPTKKIIDRLIATDPTTYFMVERDGTVIGTAGLHSGTEVGFILHPDHWRQGIVTEAMAAILPHVFDVVDFDHLTADADPENLASIACLTTLGFRVCGYAHKNFYVDGIWSDSVYFSLPRP